MPPFKVPEYFTKSPPSCWDVLSFLEHESALRKDGYDANKAIGSWISSLRYLEGDEDQETSSYAKEKLERYYNARPSDRMAAKNWHGKQKRIKAKKAKKTKISAGAKPSRTKNVFHGPVNTGSLYNSSLTLNHRTSNPPTNSSSLKEIGAGGSAGAVRGSVRADGPSVPAEPHGDDEVEDSQDEEDEDEDNDNSQLQEACNGFSQVHSRMINKLQFPLNGRSLEDSMFEYAMTLGKLSPVHFCIADPEMLSTLGGDERQLVLSRVLPLPAFPAELDKCLSRYDSVTTTAQCRTIAHNSYDDKDVLWIDDVLRHVVELITDSGHILSCDNLNEGVWDCLVYPPFWDRYFISLPDMLLQRKEIGLLASQYEPYLYLNYEARYDGVVQTRTSRRERSSRIELCVFEASSKFDGIHSKKWDKDRTKLLAGCRAMLYRLQAIVNYDTDIMTKLQVVGVLQAGRYTQLFTMSCVNRNVFYLREGQVREFPTTLECLPQAYDIISTVWKVKKIISDTATAIKNHLKDKESEKEQNEKQCRTDADFL